MIAVAATSNTDAALVIQREAALLNALIAQRIPVFFGFGFFTPAVILDLSPAARAALLDEQEDFLIAELLQTLLAVDAVAIGTV